MAGLDTAARVYPVGHEDDPDYESLCQWFARCGNHANGLRDHPILGPVPICKRCDDKVDRLQ
ncbi:hypothetical protein J4U02_gp118 [Mycobacterium phage Aziz]|uniref:Uncharacterized protein n=1 Tax=Mycobacterium phage Aziz TaxID=2762281 RepID=A0A7G8LHS2_9CAUD|nr:hypothetical protein J4U02_gp118 [Mycobacterium phage Aziz]ASR75981.1 hypothetical protein SEA_GENEVAB15_160 [Mycobacterium phage GenevaB15]QNJ56794.1 hypothetical protein SEA_AZIZ_156 [Mycobacterium phage Aziz]